MVVKRLKCSSLFSLPRLCSGGQKSLPRLSHSPIGGVIVSVLTSSAVDRGFDRRLGQTKDYTIGFCCLSAKHAALRRKIKDWLARNQDNVSEWGDMSIRELLFQ